MVLCGGGDTVMHGRAEPPVKEMGLIQNGHKDRRPLDSHFGAWVVWVDEPSPFRVTGYSKSGGMLADIGCRRLRGRYKMGTGQRPRGGVRR